MHRSEFSAAIVARPSGWLTSTFRMAICRDTHNSTPQLGTALNLILPGWGCLQTAIGRCGMRPVWCGQLRYHGTVVANTTLCFRLSALTASLEFGISRSSRVITPSALSKTTNR